MAQNTFDPTKFTTQKAKPLPVILLLDTSGSMNIVTNPNDVRDTGQTGFVDGQQVRFVEGGITRIASLNSSVKKMLNTFSRFERDSTEILVSIITFGADTRMVIPPTSASNVGFADLQASGDTPLGRGLGIAKGLIEDKNQIPSRAYRPLVVLVSDGMPNDSWQGPLADFIQNGRTAKCDRMALAISDEADRNMLAQFIEGTGREVFNADTAEQIT
ncbi:MAG: VWA domain-containing protein [Thermoguttaceae bacterium]|nr:VWA domain-containing protein [Thermoguttaceae bacterium]